MKVSWKKNRKKCVFFQRISKKLRFYKNGDKKGFFSKYRLCWSIRTTGWSMEFTLDFIKPVFTCILFLVVCGGFKNNSPISDRIAFVEIVWCLSRDQCSNPEEYGKWKHRPVSNQWKRKQRAKWRQRSWSALAQVMGWCRQAPIHYPSQCWPR